MKCVRFLFCVSFCEFSTLVSEFYCDCIFVIQYAFCKTRVFFSTTILFATQKLYLSLEKYSEPSQTFKMNPFAIKDNGWNSFDGVLNAPLLATSHLIIMQSQQ